MEAPFAQVETGYTSSSDEESPHYHRQIPGQGSIEKAFTMNSDRGTIPCLVGIATMPKLDSGGKESDLLIGPFNATEVSYQFPGIVTLSLHKSISSCLQSHLTHELSTGISILCLSYTLWWCQE